MGNYPNTAETGRFNFDRLQQAGAILAATVATMGVFGNNNQARAEVTTPYPDACKTDDINDPTTLFIGGDYCEDGVPSGYTIEERTNDAQTIVYERTIKDQDGDVTESLKFTPANPPADRNNIVRNEEFATDGDCTITTVTPDQFGRGLKRNILTGKYDLISPGVTVDCQDYAPNPTPTDPEPTDPNPTNPNPTNPTPTNPEPQPPVNPVVDTTAERIKEVQECANIAASPRAARSNLFRYRLVRTKNGLRIRMDSRIKQLSRVAKECKDMKIVSQTFRVSLLGANNRRGFKARRIVGPTTIAANTRKIRGIDNRIHRRYFKLPNRYCGADQALYAQLVVSGRAVVRDAETGVNIASKPRVRTIKLPRKLFFRRGPKC